MLKDKVYDIEIIYGEKNCEEIDSIKRVIQNNYQMFLVSLKNKRTISFLESDDPNVYVIHHFQKEFYKMLKTFMNCKDIKDILENASLLDWYLYYFSSKSEDAVCDVDIGYELEGDNLEEIYTLLIRYRYYQENGTIDEFLVNHLSCQDHDKIFNWLHDQIRFPLYNELMRMLIDEIKSDKYVLSNLEKLYFFLVEKLNEEVDDDFNVDFPSMKIEEMKQLVYEFFNDINAPQEWYNKYNEIIANNRLIVVPIDHSNTVDDFNETAFVYENNIPKIQLISTGKIDDFTAFIHEFLHYLNHIHSVNFKRFVIWELPSIYFEIIAGLFLVKKGYSNDIVKYIYKIHYYDNSICSFDNCLLIYRILDYMNNGEDDESKEINDIIEQGERSIRLGTIDFISDDLDEIKTNIRNYFDEINHALLNNGIMALSGINYIIAMEIIDHLDLEKVIGKMMDIGENLNCYSLKKILQIFNYDLFGDLNKKHTKHYSLKK